jgi:hypothetical protein
LVSNLKDQLTLFNDPAHSRLRKHWVKTDGERIVKEKRVPVRPGWSVTLDGQVAVFIRSGLKKIEFEKGKTAIVLPSVNELPKILNGLIDAVQKGELDHFLEPKPSVASVPKRKVA